LVLREAQVDRRIVGRAGIARCLQLRLRQIHRIIGRGHRGAAGQRQCQYQNSRCRTDAANLAEESRADAELARAKARLGAARAQIQGQVQENSRLRSQDEQAAAAEQQQQAAPAASSSTVPTEDMPAPSPSELSAPSSGAGFQTLPENGQPPASSSSTQEVQP
ncbi:MAG: hypothetical protein ACHP7C_09415, partial [Lysobacterales bacterium]